MTRQDLADHVRYYNCDPSPIEGINIRGNQIRIINRNDPSKYAYLDTPINNREVPDFVVQRVCMLLGIPLPKKF